MPKEPAAEVVEKEEEVQLKGGEPGTLASKLESPHPVFSGHPAAGGEPFEPEKEEPEGEPEPEAKAGEPEKKEEEPPKAPEKKYKTWEEAEAGAKEAMRFGTEKAEEAARLREENEALKAKIEAKPPEKEPEKEKPPVKTKDEIESETTSAIEGALDEIGQLDEFDPEYKKKVARAWAKAGFGGRGQAEIPDDFGDLVEQRVQAALDARDKKTDERTVREKANSMAGEAGLDMSEDSLDFIAFWHLAGKAPDAPFSEQVKWTIEEVRKKKGAPPSMTKEEKDRVARTQIENAPLEKGGPGPSPQAEPSPKARSLSQIVDESMQSRII